MVERSQPLQENQLNWWWTAPVLALVFVRTWPYVQWGTLSFDADQAVIGLMAKHIAEFRAMPVYQYALPYVLTLTAYVAAPFMWAFGPTILALKAPLAIVNLGVGAGTVVAVRRAGLGWATAIVLAMPVLLPSGVAAANLMDALGMTVEPAAFVLALWFLRGRPILLGLVAAVGFHVREFVAYGVAALVAVDLWQHGVAHWRRRARDLAATAVAATCTSALVAGWARFSSFRGPGTSVPAEGLDSLATLGGAFCFVPTAALDNVVILGRVYLGWIWGAAPAPLSDVGVHSHVIQGLPGAWPVLGLALAAVSIRVLAGWRQVWTRRGTNAAALGLFLVLVGMQSVLVYAASRCGPITLVTLRYALLSLFLPTGMGLLLWSLDAGVAWRRLLALTLASLGALNLHTHVQLWREQLSGPAPPSRVVLTRALDAEGIRYASADYWTAYYVSFLSQERILVAADVLPRVQAHELAVATHAREAVRISTTPCDGARPIAAGFVLCPYRP